MKIKKWIAGMAIGAMVLGMGCTSAMAEGDDGKITIGWAMAYYDHPVYQLLMQGANEVAEGLDNCELIFADGKNDATTQASQIDNFIAQDVDAIILTAAVSDP